MALLSPIGRIIFAGMEFLPLSAIAIDCDMLFARAGFDRATVERYSNAITDRHTLPPVTVYFDGADYWLADGFHRFAACEELGCTDIPVDIRHGTKQEALLFSLGADATHGKPRVWRTSRTPTKRQCASDCARRGTRLRWRSSSAVPTLSPANSRRLPEPSTPRRRRRRGACRGERRHPSLAISRTCRGLSERPPGFLAAPGPPRPDPETGLCPGASPATVGPNRIGPDI